MTRRALRRSLLLLFLTTSIALAQNSGTIVGNIHDASGAQIGGATITVTNGSVSQTVEVTSAAPLIRTESAELGEVAGEKPVQSLPLNGRNFAQLVYLVPGVTAGQQGENLGGASTFNPRAGSNFNALGAQEGSSGWLVDGIIDNEYTFNTVMVQPSVESIQEFKVLTGVYSAEYGRGSGIPIKERVTLQFRVDAFDALNHPPMGFPNQTLSSTAPATSSTAITNTYADNRDLQASLKLTF